eukprot:TRINITY_DN2935_c0_g1_i2.p1 TRINITY_DN2935_c0_g1~~TRINITY_DN2935_c0_g1_i2.p1  ORF type:complete len:1541 (-),score=499.21 TRINITY_DN2935_c0_g1_i2:206-4828(-)
MRNKKGSPSKRNLMLDLDEHVRQATDYTDLLRTLCQENSSFLSVYRYIIETFPLQLLTENFVREWLPAFCTGLHGLGQADQLRALTSLEVKPSRFDAATEEAPCLQFFRLLPDIFSVFYGLLSNRPDSSATLDEFLAMPWPTSFVSEALYLFRRFHLNPSQVLSLLNRVLCCMSTRYVGATQDLVIVLERLLLCSRGHWAPGWGAAICAFLRNAPAAHLSGCLSVLETTMHASGLAQPFVDSFQDLFADDATGAAPVRPFGAVDMAAIVLASAPSCRTQVLETLCDVCYATVCNRWPPSVELHAPAEPDAGCAATHVSPGLHRLLGATIRVLPQMDRFLDVFLELATTLCEASVTAKRAEQCGTELRAAAVHLLEQLFAHGGAEARRAVLCLALVSLTAAGRLPQPTLGTDVACQVLQTLSSRQTAAVCEFEPELQPCVAGVHRLPASVALSVLSALSPLFRASGSFFELALREMQRLMVSSEESAKQLSVQGLVLLLRSRPDDAERQDAALASLLAACEYRVQSRAFAYAAIASAFDAAEAPRASTIVAESLVRRLQRHFVPLHQLAAAPTAAGALQDGDGPVRPVPTTPSGTAFSVLTVFERYLADGNAAEAASVRPRETLGGLVRAVVPVLPFAADEPAARHLLRNIADQLVNPQCFLRGAAGQDAQRPCADASADECAPAHFPEVSPEYVLESDRVKQMLPVYEAFIDIVASGDERACQLLPALEPSGRPWRLLLLEFFAQLSVTAHSSALPLVSVELLAELLTVFIDGLEALTPQTGLSVDAAACAVEMLSRHAVQPPSPGTASSGLGKQETLLAVLSKLMQLFCMMPNERAIPNAVYALRVSSLDELRRQPKRRRTPSIERRRAGFFQLRARLLGLMSQLTSKLLMRSAKPLELLYAATVRRRPVAGLRAVAVAPICPDRFWSWALFWTEHFRAEVRPDGAGSLNYMLLIESFAVAAGDRHEPVADEVAEIIKLLEGVLRSGIVQHGSVTKTILKFILKYSEAEAGLRLALSALKQCLATPVRGKDSGFRSDNSGDTPNEDAEPELATQSSASQLRRQAADDSSGSDNDAATAQAELHICRTESVRTSSLWTCLCHFHDLLLKQQSQSALPFGLLSYVLRALRALRGPTRVQLSAEASGVVLQLSWRLLDVCASCCRLLADTVGRGVPVGLQAGVPVLRSVVKLLPRLRRWLQRGVASFGGYNQRRAQRALDYAAVFDSSLPVLLSVRSSLPPTCTSERVLLERLAALHTQQREAADADAGHSRAEVSPVQQLAVEPLGGLAAADLAASPAAGANALAFGRPPGPGMQAPPPEHGHAPRRQPQQPLRSVLQARLDAERQAIREYHVRRVRRRTIELEEARQALLVRLKFAVEAKADAERRDDYLSLRRRTEQEKELRGKLAVIHAEQQALESQAQSDGVAELPTYAFDAVDELADESAQAAGQEPERDVLDSDSGTDELPSSEEDDDDAASDSADPDDQDAEEDLEMVDAEEILPARKKRRRAKIVSNNDKVLRWAAEDGDDDQDWRDLDDFIV